MLPISGMLRADRLTEIRLPTLFTRAAAKDESLTFGSNTGGALVRANQSVILVNGK